MSTATIPLPIPRPAGDSPAVRELCSRLVPATIPEYVPLSAPPWARPGECTENVERVVREHGGECELGWQLWETLPGVLLEAEFHAVWRGDRGQRLDITPKLELPHLERIAFLPDPVLIYKGRQIDNVRVALRDDPLIHKFIAAAERHFQLMNAGDLGSYTGPVRLSPRMRDAMRRQAMLGQQIVQKYYVPSSRTTQASS